MVYRIPSRAMPVWLAMSTLIYKFTQRLEYLKFVMAIKHGENYFQNHVVRLFCLETHNILTDLNHLHLQ